MPGKKKEFSETVINAFLRYDKIVDIVKVTGLSRSTIERYRDSQELQKILSERRIAYVEAAVVKMQSFLCEGVEILQNIIRNNDTSAQTKVNAIQVLFGQCKVWTEIMDIQKQLEVIESKMAEYDEFKGVTR